MVVACSNKSLSSAISFSLFNWALRFLGTFTFTVRFVALNWIVAFTLFTFVANSSTKLLIPSSTLIEKFPCSSCPIHDLIVLASSVTTVPSLNVILMQFFKKLLRYVTLAVRSVSVTLGFDRVTSEKSIPPSSPFSSWRAKSKASLKSIALPKVSFSTSKLLPFQVMWASLGSTIFFCCNSGIVARYIANCPSLREATSFTPYTLLLFLSSCCLAKISSNFPSSKTKPISLFFTSYVVPSMKLSLLVYSPASCWTFSNALSTVRYEQSMPPLNVPLKKWVSLNSSTFKKAKRVIIPIANHSNGVKSLPHCRFVIKTFLSLSWM